MSSATTEPRRRKLIENERLYRRANELIDGGRNDHVRGRKELFLCECSDEDCSDTIELVWDDYRAVREHAVRFVIRPGHETAGIDRLVETHDSYLVVDKIP